MQRQRTATRVDRSSSRPDSASQHTTIAGALLALTGVGVVLSIITNEALYPAERLFLNPDCGFGTFSNRPVNQTETALAKLASAVSAARSMRGG